MGLLRQLGYWGSMVLQLRFDIMEHFKEKAMDMNRMAEQVLGIPTLLESSFVPVEKAVREILSTPEIYSIKDIIITGCGDSFAAALCAKRTFQEFSGCNVDVLSPLDVSRYVPRSRFSRMPGNPLVIALSSSGKAARTVEAAKRAARLGSITLSITALGDSPLSESCGKNLVLDVPSYPRCPGVAGYLMQLLALQLIAIRIGEVRMLYTMDQANQKRNALKDVLAKASEAVGEDVLRAAIRAAEANAGVSSAEIIAQWFDEGVGYFIQQKCYEAVGIPAVFGDSENWFHSNKFLRNFDEAITFILLRNGDPGASRCRELMKRMDYMKRRSILFTDDPTLVDIGIPVPCGDAHFSSILFSLAPALVIAYLSSEKGEVYSRGFAYPWSDDPSIASTVSSEFVDVDGDEEAACSTK